LGGCAKKRGLLLFPQLQSPSSAVEIRMGRNVRRGRWCEMTRMRRRSSPLSSGCSASEQVESPLPGGRLKQPHSFRGIATLRTSQ